jgi:hypothetical protein
MNRLRWIAKNWKWLVLLWFNAIATILSLAFSYLLEWGVGLIFYLSLLVSAGLLVWWQVRPVEVSLAQSSAIVAITDQAIFVGESGCCCKYCGSENQFLPHYPFDPRLSRPSVKA